MIFVLMVLATARITRFVTTDVLFQEPRNWTLRKLLIRQDGTERTHGFRTGLGYLIVCDWCASVYVGGAVSGAWMLWGENMAFMGLMAALAASYATGFLSAITDRGE